MSGTSHSSSTPSPQSRVVAIAACAIGALLLAWIVYHHLTHPDDHAEAHVPAMWALGTLPFAALLGAIAVLPLMGATQHWWDNNRNRLIVSLICGAATLIYLAFAEGASTLPGVLGHAIAQEYIPFMMLLFSLYVISGGISLKGDLPAHPITNTIFLAVGALIASVVGTTGASMLLIRPLLQTNSERKKVAHTVVFFIFLVSNCGGCLLPIGDPPLFLGYLRGVPFLWTLNLWREWAVVCGLLLAIYYIWDSIEYRHETKASIRRDEAVRKPLRLRGSINFLWLLCVVVVVALLDPHKIVPGTNWSPFPYLRELIMLALVALSLLTTPNGVRNDNKFNYHAILEVAALFIGIFITMQVPIMVLNATGDQLGLEHPWQFFWITGGLSSVLDNAPTYVVFFETANALTHEPGPGIIQLISGHFIREDLLVAISLGAVFMGANTYIGNGPNFMVKSIAEQSGVKMPSFFGYVFRYSLPVLVPVFVLLTFLFMMK